MTIVAISSLAIGCAALDPESVSDSAGMALGTGTPVPAAGETAAVGTKVRDAADDPEIWADPRDPSRGVILGTDKQAGLYVYDLAGGDLQFLAEGPLNNVDLRDGFAVGGKAQVLIGASDRGRSAIAFFLLDPDSLNVTPWGRTPVKVSEPYGFCMGRLGGDTVAVMVGKDGDVAQFTVTDQGGQPAARLTRSFAVGSQSEGCVVDDAAGVLYVAEEAKGIWRYGLDPAAGADRTLLAGAPSEILKPDVEGLTLLREGAATYLLASSQGDSAFAVWRVDGAEPAYAGRFSVVPGAGADAVTGTDGLAALGGRVGAFPEGLIVVQDDSDTDGETTAGARARQNFKLVDWRAVKAALELN
ncbi:phytase [Phenylobacterium sp.]|uniref:phytase n=1 Tax=Phenylobacterium sp. TaxID=1871053 RepID=UPI002897BD15|nr:phytase [Phenylobacterium sp.]